MAYKVSLVVVFLFALTLGLSSQTATTHPTINDVVVFYSSSPQTTLSGSSNSPMAIASIPNATVSLKSQVNIAKIHLKIVNLANDSILYNINYTINSSIVTNSSGKKLFENNNGSIYVSPGFAMPLKPYSYKVSTEDTLQILSPVFSKIQ